MTDYATTLFELLGQAGTLSDIEDVAAAIERVEPELDRHAFNALHLALYIKREKTRHATRHLCSEGVQNNN